MSSRNKAIMRRAFDEGHGNGDTLGLVRQIGALPVEVA